MQKTAEADENTEKYSPSPWRLQPTQRLTRTARQPIQPRSQSIFPCSGSSPGASLASSLPSLQHREDALLYESKRFRAFSSWAEGRALLPFSPSPPVTQPASFSSHVPVGS